MCLANAPASPLADDHEVETVNWSQTHYNLIVSGNTETPVFQTSSGRDTFPASRLLEGAACDLKAKYDPDPASLNQMLALVVGEWSFEDSARLAYVLKVDEIEKRGRHVYFRFDRLLGPFNSEEVFTCGHFDISFDRRWGGETTRTHWTVKQANLIEGILRLFNAEGIMQLLNHGCPRSFNLQQWPLPTLGHIAVMMPFESKFDGVYSAVKTACEKLQLTALRVDQIYGPTAIIDDVFKTIEQSRLVVSDLTGRNPNVLYETGLAHARDREVIMIVQNGADVPFDLRHIRYVPYLPNQEGLEKLVENLVETMRTVLEP